MSSTVRHWFFFSFFFFGNWTFINNSNSNLFFQSNSSANWRVSMEIIHKQLIDDEILYVSFSCVNECRKRASISRWNMQPCLFSQTVNFLFSDASGKLCYIPLKCLSYSQDFLFRCLSLCLSPQQHKKLQGPPYVWYWGWVPITFLVPTFILICVPTAHFALCWGTAAGLPC